jgi:hypothetical protein
MVPLAAVVVTVGVFAVALVVLFVPLLFLLVPFVVRGIPGGKTDRRSNSRAQMHRWAVC